MLSLQKVVLFTSLVFFVGISGASAQLKRTHVSAVGSDSNNCDFATPCKTFQRAHDLADAGGEVIALNGLLDQTPLVVTKGMSFYAFTGDAAQRPYINVSSGDAVTINAPSNAVVTFVNFAITGAGTGSNGIRFNSGQELRVVGGAIRGFNAAAPNGFGIRFLPSTVSKLLVQEAILIGNGAGTTGGGIQVSPVGSGGAQILIDRARIELNAFGFAIDTTNSSNGVNAVVNNSQIHGNQQDGIVVVGGSPIGLLVRDSIVFANAIGVRAIGANVNARLINASIQGNATGITAVGGGAVQSYGTNTIDGNGVNGTPSNIPTK